jgi:exodeoxyribonuclease VII large subunit
MTTRRPSPPAKAAAATRPLSERLQSTLFESPAPAVVMPEPKAPERAPISISELTDRMGRHLAAAFSSVCVMGEISKVTIAANGHTYFTLKDAGSTLDAILWASNREAMGVQPKLGLRVVATGAIRVFNSQGRYSLHIDTLDLVGVGDLQRALEALKTRLRAEGLFADERKRPLPRMVHTIGVVTSPTGAVRQDIEQTLARGGARVRVLLSPTRVQGEGASAEIAAAIDLLAQRDDVDLIIVARGGGSIEDLWPFNEEVVARAIVASLPPVISAVGHESDFTVSDFVADVRAATPSVAAGMVVDIKRRATERTEAASVGLRRAIDTNRDRWRRRLDAVSTHRVIERERNKLDKLRGRLAATLTRARVAVDRRQAARAAAFRDLATRCEAQAPTETFARAHARVDRAVATMVARIDARLGVVSTRFTEDVRLLVRGIRPLLDRRRSRFGGVVSKLEALSPLAVLSRGYALATTPEGRILLRAEDVKVGDPMVVRLSRGRVKATVTDREEEA